VQASRSTATRLLFSSLSGVAWLPQRLGSSFTSTWQLSLRAMDTRQFKAVSGPSGLKNVVRSVRPLSDPFAGYHGLSFRL
jgi:hypothetical protein